MQDVMFQTLSSLLARDSPGMRYSMALAYPEREHAHCVGRL